MNSLYETDFYKWCLDQSESLMFGKLDQLDLANLAEEIKGMGRSEKNELVNRLSVLICHIIKWIYQPELRSNSWKYTIWEQQERIKDLLNENPSLTNEEIYDHCLAKAYSYGIKQASAQTGLNSQQFNDMIRMNPMEFKFDIRQ